MYNNPKINNINKNIDEIANRLAFNTNNTATCEQLNREISNIDTKLENIVQRNINYPLRPNFQFRNNNFDINAPFNYPRQQNQNIDINYRPPVYPQIRPTQPIGINTLFDFPGQSTQPIYNNLPIPAGPIIPNQPIYNNLPIPAVPIIPNQPTYNMQIPAVPIIPNQPTYNTQIPAVPIIPNQPTNNTQIPAATIIPNQPTNNTQTPSVTMRPTVISNPTVDNNRFAGLETNLFDINNKLKEVIKNSPPTNLNNQQNNNIPLRDANTGEIIKPSAIEQFGNSVLDFFRNKKIGTTQKNYNDERMNRINYFSNKGGMSRRFKNKRRKSNMVKTSTIKRKNNKRRTIKKYARKR
jgi:hypothetical protein